jgi:hypothetical protein
VHGADEGAFAAADHAEAHSFVSHFAAATFDSHLSPP